MCDDEEISIGKNVDTWNRLKAALNTIVDNIWSSKFIYFMGVLG